MQKSHVAAVLLIASLGVRSAAAQPAPSEPLGTGPRVDVQTSGNGTLDVGGARGTDLNLTGENFRGNFGASRPQSGATTSPNSPAGRLPLYGTRAPAAPNFGPSLPDGAPPAGSAGRYGDNLDATDLILPRFRRNLATSEMHPNAAPAHADGWRYRYFGGRWWYWQASQDWVYWNGAQWLSYAGR